MDVMKEAASCLRHLIIGRYNLTEPQIRMLESGRWAKNRNVAGGLQNRGLVKTRETPAGEVYDGFTKEGEDVAGALRFTARVLKDNAS